EFSFQQDFASYPCSDNLNQQEMLARVEPKQDDYYTDSEMYQYDYYDYDYYYPDGYSWQDRDNPCTVSYYTSDKNVNKNVLASNLGLNFKTGKNKTGYATVTDLLSAKPMENVTIKAYDLQNQLVGEGSTDGKGFAEFKMSRKPFLIVA